MDQLVALLQQLFFEVLFLYNGKHKCFIRTAVLVKTKALTIPALVCSIISEGAVKDKNRTGRMIRPLNSPSAIHYFQPRGFPDSDMVCLVENSQGISLTPFPLKAIFLLFLLFYCPVPFHNGLLYFFSCSEVTIPGHLLSFGSF